MSETLKNGDDNSHSLQIIGFLVTVILLMLYLTIGMYMESKHFRFGHETVVIIIIGIITSIITVFSHNKDVSFLEWNNSLFFEMLLPLIVFTTGYNIRRRNFFENFVNISKFGLLGTFLTFVFYTLLTYALFSIFTINKYDPNTNKTIAWNLDFTSISYMCSILTGSDIIAAVTLIKFDD
jgi:hypothetical protein